MIQDTRRNMNKKQKHRKRSRRRIIQNTDTKLIRRETLSRRGNERRFVFIPFQVSFSPCLRRARLVFSMFFHGFRFLTHSHRHTVSPPINRRIALLFYSILYTFYNAASKRYKMNESKKMSEGKTNF